MKLLKLYVELLKEFAGMYEDAIIYLCEGKTEYKLNKLNEITDMIKSFVDNPIVYSNDNNGSTIIDSEAEKRLCNMIDAINSLTRNMYDFLKYATIEWK